VETDLATPPTRAPERGRVRTAVAVSAVALAVQVNLTDYGTDQVGARVFWLVVGLWLLWLVLRRASWVARTLVAANGLIGAAIYAVNAVTGDLHGLVLCLVFLAEGLPLMTPAVQRHVAPRRVTAAD
jgi:hypothetical protein